MKIFITAQWRQQIVLSTENEEEVELCVNVTFVVRRGDEGSVRGPDFDDPHGLAAFVP